MRKFRWYFAVFCMRTNYFTEHYYFGQDEHQRRTTAKIKISLTASTPPSRFTSSSNNTLAFAVSALISRELGFTLCSAVFHRQEPTPPDDDVLSWFVVVPIEMLLLQCWVFNFPTRSRIFTIAYYTTPACSGYWRASGPFGSTYSCTCMYVNIMHQSMCVLC